MNNEMNLGNLSPVSAKQKSTHSLSWVKLNQGLILSVVFFIFLLSIVSIVNGRMPSYFGMSMLIASSATLALAAIGQSVIVIGGRLDLSVGAIVSFSQAVLAVYITQFDLPPSLLILIAIGIGMLAGCINGFFVAAIGLQPIIVTLATMFTLQGVTLLVLPQPGGMVPDDMVSMLLDDTIMDVIPGPVTIIVIALLVWGIIKQTPLGTSIFAAGSDHQSASLVGIKVKRGIWLSYVIGGGFYGAAGAFAAAQSGAADPLIGAPMLVSTLTAVMLGGTLLSGGRGTAIGSVFGALTVISMVNLLLAFGAPDFLASGIQALVLLLAVIVNRPGAKKTESELRRFGLMLKNLGRVKSTAVNNTATFAIPGVKTWLPKTDRKFIMPAWVGFIILTGIAYAYYGEAFSFMRYADRLLVLSAFLAILVLGQGVVVMSGGFDLSVGWSVTTCGVISAMIMQGSDLSLIWTIPIVLLIGAAIGLVNGLLVSVVRLSPIVATLAIGGILQSLIMFISGGTPSGSAAPLLKWFINGKVFGSISPISLAIFVFVIFGVVLLTCTPFSRRLIATGTNAKAAFLCGVNVRSVTIMCYVISGICCALAGMLLTGFLGRASLTLGGNYLLPTVAAVAIGGTLISGGRGHYLGMFGGVLALTALQILLSGTSLPPAVRDIMLGLAVLFAVISLRDKN
ncbi:ABC transporter permease [Vibrio sp.]|nr:ABC transporter permease [Vibrio sp.]